jgi:hypothetical protein
MRRISRILSAWLFGWACLANCAWGAPPPLPRVEPAPRAAPSTPAAQLPVPAIVAQKTVQEYQIAIDRSRQKLLIESPKQESWAYDRLRGEEGAEVTREGAELRQGTKVLARLAKGRKLYITSIKENWAGATILVNGEPQSGWVTVADLKPLARESRAYRHLQNVGGGRFVSAAMLMQKAKQFDDGLYAAVELAAQRGLGAMPGKSAWLQQWSEATKPASEMGLTVLLAAGKLGGGQPAIPGIQQKPVTDALKKFNASPVHSKPLGFYTWSPELEAIFRQDRMLQTELSQPACQAIVAALQGSPQLLAAYRKHLALAARLTNPQIAGEDSDLLPLADHSAAIKLADVKRWRIYPPSTSHEGELFNRLFGDELTVPSDFDLMNRLIAEIRAGRIDLAPRPDSGWYDQQTWALQALLSPEKMPERSHLTFGAEYRKLLEELFKGTLALTRETHVKQLDIPRPASAAPPFEVPMPKLDLFIEPGLVVEPLPEMYLRRARSYEFVRNVLVDAFGEAALAEIRRQTPDGPVAESLADELRDMIAIFQGAHVASSRQLGRTEAAGTDDDGKAFVAWAARVASDPDLGRDSRMMVPVFQDPLQGRLKVWCHLGWSWKRAYVSYQSHPAISAKLADGTAVNVSERFDVHYQGQSLELPSPVFAEVWVTKLLNRDEFRRHCDTYIVPAVIAANLE